MTACFEFQFVNKLACCEVKPANAVAKNVARIKRLAIARNCQSAHGPHLLASLAKTWSCFCKKFFAIRKLQLTTIIQQSLAVIENVNQVIKPSTHIQLLAIF